MTSCWGDTGQEGHGCLIWSEEAAEAVGRGRHKLSQAFSSRMPGPKGLEASGRPCLRLSGLTAPGEQADCGVSGSEGQRTTELGGQSSQTCPQLPWPVQAPPPALPAPGRCAGRSEERALPTLRMYKRPGQRRVVRAFARDAWTPRLNSLGGVPLWGPSHNSQSKGHLLAWVLSCFSPRPCWSLYCPLLTQVQGQPGRRRQEGLRAGAGPGPGGPSVLHQCPTALGWG